MSRLISLCPCHYKFYTCLTIKLDQPGSVAQSEKYLATEACLTGDLGIARSIRALSHIFVQIVMKSFLGSFPSLPLIIQEGLLSVTRESM